MYSSPFFSGCSGSVLRSPPAAMKQSSLPSQSQVRSEMIASRVGRFGVAVDRHHRKHLADGPGVGQRLEDAEVAVVDIGQALAQPLQGGRHNGAEAGGDPLGDGKEDVFAQRALAQADGAGA